MPIYPSAMAFPDEIWLVNFGEPSPGEPAHHRPALVVGPAAVFGNNFPFAIVVPMTTTRRELALHVELEPTADNGLDETSYLQCELLRSVNARRLIMKLGTVDPGTSKRVAGILRTLLDY
jgi:mRNA interferase MazF